MDYKAAAAGDQEEISRRNEERSASPVSSEYAASIILWLETFTGKTLNDDETALWTRRLLQYPVWKLKQINDYTGGLNNGVFAFLDSLQRQPEKFRPPQLADYSVKAREEKECGAKLFHGLSEILGTGPQGKAAELINALHAKLREEYPQFKANLRMELSE